MKSDEPRARRTSGSVLSHIDRRQRLREVLRAEDLDALLVTDLINIRYLTGFTGSAAALWVAAGDGPEEKATVLCTDGRYRTQAAAQVPDLRALIDRRYGAALVAHAPAGRAGFESHVVTVDGFDKLAEAATDVELVRAPNRIEKLREVKDDSEVLLLERACAAADTALAALIETGGIRPGAPNVRWRGTWKTSWRSMARTARPSRPSWPPGRTRQYRITGPPARCWLPGTS
ncbi:putative metallopeptidase [Mycobacteroides abscessus MAB_030201_1075]|uniref:Putative metallopeptidase n=1 Tax=Mycobacteroides abscessus MAB_030201_1075 TaxID=1335410 RepID=A0A829PS34_9MYCO|nr:putative metallopeptidase [Mycobacteroides abscessus MAB_030201_1075]